MAGLPEVESVLLRLLEAKQLYSIVPWDRLAQIRNLVTHAEYGVATENLCENLFGISEPLDDSWLEGLERVVVQLGLDAYYLKIVRGLRHTSSS